MVSPSQPALSCPAEVHQALVSQFQQDLSQEHPLHNQVVNYIADHHSMVVEQLPEFFATKVATLDDVELDLTFSPMYTPTLEDRARYAAIVQGCTLEEGDLEALLNALESAGLKTTLTTPAGDSIEWSIPEAVILRYVEKMNLHKPLPPKVYQAMVDYIPLGLQPVFFVLGRESIWQDNHRQEILLDFLQAFGARGTASQERMQTLTDFVRTYRPKSLEEFDRQLVKLIASCKEDKTKVHDRSYHDEQLRTNYANQVEADHHEAEEVKEHYDTLIHQAEALRDDYQFICSRPK